MAFTGRLGVELSKLGNIVLGDSTLRDSEITRDADNAISFSQDVVMHHAFNRPTSQIISFTQSVPIQFLRHHLTDSFFINQTLRLQASHNKLFDTVFLSQTLRLEQREQRIHQNLSFSESVRLEMPRNVLEQTIDLVETVRCQSTINRLADIMGFVDDVRGQSLNQRPKDHLTFMETTVYKHSIHRDSPQDTIILAQSCEQHGPLSRSLSQELTVSDEVEVEASKSVVDVIPISDDVGVRLLPLQKLSQTINLQDTHHLRYSLHREVIDLLQQTVPVLDLDTLQFSDTYIGLSDSVQLSMPISRVASDNISLTQHANGYVLRADAINLTANDTLSLTQWSAVSIPLDASNTLSLAQTVYGDVSKVAKDVLSLSDSATFSTNRALSANSTLSLYQAVLCVVDKGETLCHYSPFIGSSSDPNAPSQIPSTLPAASAYTGFRLLFPASGTVTDEVILRSPNFGDIDRFAADRLNIKTRGGTLIIYSDPDWPKIETLVLNFSSLTRSAAYGLQTFMKNHLGVRVRLIDQENREWRGVITKFDGGVIEDTRRSYSTGFEFEGERVEA